MIFPLDYDSLLLFSFLCILKRGIDAAIIRDISKSRSLAAPKSKLMFNFEQLLNMDEPILNEHNKAEFPPAHTAEHLLNATMVKMFGCERSKNMHIERKKSKINYLLSEAPTAEQIAEVEATINRLIAEDLPVTFEFVTRDTIPEGVKLDKLPEDASETLRLVRIGHYDVCPCIGTHVASTKGIGSFRITSTSFSEGSFRIVFKVAEE